MALQTIPGGGPVIPEPYRALVNVPAMSSALVIDAAAEKIAFCGRAWNKDRATKSITKLGFRFGAVTKTNGSSLTVSLQDVSLTAGPPMQPDETQDQTVTIANGDAGFTSNVWYQTAALSANRSVAYGELLGVVIEFAGFTAGDSVVIQGASGTESHPLLHTVSALKTASWVAQSVVPNVILEFTDGTFGTLFGAFPATAISSVTYKQDTAGADEHALEFTMPFPCKVDGAWVLLGTAAASDFDVLLYDGTTVMTGGQVSIDANAISVNSSAARYLFVPFSQEISLSANTTYRLSVQPTQTTASVTLYYFDVNANGHLQAHQGTAAWNITDRLDAGSWSAATNTRRPFMGLRISALDDGVGGGGTTVRPTGYR